MKNLKILAFVYFESSLEIGSKHSCYFFARLTFEQMQTNDGIQWWIWANKNTAEIETWTHTNDGAPERLPVRTHQQMRVLNQPVHSWETHSTFFFIEAHNERNIFFFSILALVFRHMLLLLHYLCYCLFRSKMDQVFFFGNKNGLAVANAGFYAPKIAIKCTKKLRPNKKWVSTQSFGRNW